MDLECIDEGEFGDLHDEFENVVDLADDDRPNNELRRGFYSVYTRILHGTLGARYHVCLPKCVEDGIRHVFPNENGVYMGYMSS